MVRGSPCTAGSAGRRNQAAIDSSALGIGVGSMASSLDHIVCRDADDLAVQCVATALLVQVDRPKPPPFDCGGEFRGCRTCARRIGPGTLGARTIAVVATWELLPCCDCLAVVRSARSESSR